MRICNRSGYRSALGALRETVAGVLYVAASVDFSICCNKRSTNVEVRIGRIGTLAHKRCSLNGHTK